MEHQFMQYPGGRMKALTMSYDDGTEFDARFAQKVTEYGLKCTFNLCAMDHIGLTKEQVEELILKPGHEIAVHCASHCAPGVIRPIDGIREVLDNRLDLERTFGRIVRGMAYPNSGIRSLIPGNSYETIRQYLQDLDIAYARSLGGDNDGFHLPTDWYNWIPTLHQLNPEFDRMADRFFEQTFPSPYYPSTQPTLFYIWGHAFEFQNKWEKADEICQKLAGHSDVWYATNIEIYDYVQAYNSLQYSADRTIVYNPTRLDVWFQRGHRDVCIRAGETVRLEIE